MPKLIKKILLVYISIVLTFAPFSVYAASAGGWAFNSYDVATSIVTALKGGASASVAVAKSPISQKIAKGIVGGAIVGAALPLAISQITGIALTSLDWVLDSANNRIKYTVPADTSDPANPANQFYYQVWSGGSVDSPSLSARGATPEAACAAWFAYIKTVGITGQQQGVTTDTACLMAGGGVSGYLNKIANPAYNPSNSGTVEKYIPIPTVADKIYDNAKTDSASASIVNDAVKDYVNEGSADVALDAAKAEADATHNCGTGTSWNGSACVADTPTTPDTPFDPTDIIDAIGKVFDAVMSLPDVINNALDSLLNDIKDFFQPVLDKVTDMIDWFKSDPDPQTDNTKPDIDTTPPTKSATDFDTDYLRFGGQCPSFSPTTISVGIVAVPISFNAQPLCDFAILCRPIILALAYFAAMAIVANAIRSE